MLDWLPENVSTYGGRIDFFFYVIYYITAGVFFLVAGAMIYFLVKYRHREGRRAVYSHGNTTLEWIWTSATTVAMLVLALVSKPLWGEIKQSRPAPDVQVRVAGKQFNWQIVYPGPDAQFDTADDYQIDNDLHVPLDAVVHVHLSSLDVIHSFFVPQLRLKQDAVPGHHITAWFKATKPGVYEIPCAELCGFGHSGMKGTLYVDTKEDYDAWVQQTWPPAAEEAAPSDLAPAENEQ